MVKLQRRNGKLFTVGGKLVRCAAGDCCAVCSELSYPISETQPDLVAFSTDEDTTSVIGSPSGTGSPLSTVLTYQGTAIWSGYLHHHWSNPDIQPPSDRYHNNASEIDVYMRCYTPEEVDTWLETEPEPPGYYRQPGAWAFFVDNSLFSHGSIRNIDTSDGISIEPEDSLRGRMISANIDTDPDGYFTGTASMPMYFNDNHPTSGFLAYNLHLIFNP